MLDKCSQKGGIMQNLRATRSASPKFYKCRARLSHVFSLLLLRDFLTGGEPIPVNRAPKISKEVFLALFSSWSRYF
jgi:hypothetical protein